MSDDIPIILGGITPFSSIDYPNHLAAVIFCQGCPWHCHYCHNPHLQQRKPQTIVQWDEAIELLNKRRKLLDAVVFSGGEPLLQPGLAHAMWQVRQMGFYVGIHSAGIYPERLAGIMPLVDWIGLDIKAPFSEYPRITGAKFSEAPAKALSYVIASGKPYEIRCTVDETLLSPIDGANMATELAAAGVSRLTLQARREQDGTSHTISRHFIEAVRKNIEHVELRT